MLLLEKLIDLDICKSKSEGKRLITLGKIAVNGEIEKNVLTQVTKKDKVQKQISLIELISAAKPKEGYRWEFINVDIFQDKVRAGILISWGAIGIGIGQLTIFIEKGKLIADTECMDREFVEALLVAAKDKIFEKMKII